MSEVDSTYREPKPSSFNPMGALALSMLVLICGGSGYGLWDNHQRSKYEAFDPSKDADLLDKVRNDTGGGFKYRPGMPIPFGFSLESSAQDTPNTLVFGQPVENRRGETAIAVCKLAVDTTIFDSHKVGEHIAPDQIKTGCNEIPSLRQPLAEAVKTWPQLSPTPSN